MRRQAKKREAAAAAGDGSGDGGAAQPGARGTAPATAEPDLAALKALAMAGDMNAAYNLGVRHEAAARHGRTQGAPRSMKEAAHWCAPALGGSIVRRLKLALGHQRVAP